MNPANAIIELGQKLAAHPWIYDRIQIMAGREKVLEKMLRQTTGLSAQTVVDVGGGTGQWRRLWPVRIRYICLDIEMPKLQGFRYKVPAGLAVLSDASQMPIATRSVDVVVCVAVLHHLTDTMLELVFDEALRVLKADGHFILLDAVFNLNLWSGRVLWRLDRGSNPRTAEDLRQHMESRFKIIHWEKFAIYHEYVFGIGMRP
jgi:ubiquinone/menaquinone biosynthesis C-methylase UbiE